MLSLKTLKTYYSPRLQNFPIGILREYLQYKILESIYNSQYTTKLVFLGGTALRIVYGNQRFSEDLDFDNIGLTKEEFASLSKYICQSLLFEGYEVEIKNVYMQVFHCYIKIPKLLYKEGLSNLKNHKIIIRIDTTPQHYKYKAEKYLLDKFDVLKGISVVSKELLLAQKFTAFFGRKVPKGRDVFDINYLLSRGVKPDMKYIKEKININKFSLLIKETIQYSNKINLKRLAIEVRPFLFNPEHDIRVQNFLVFLSKII